MSGDFYRTDTRDNPCKITAQSAAGVCPLVCRSSSRTSGLLSSDRSTAVARTDFARLRYPLYFRLQSPDPSFCCARLFVPPPDIRACLLSFTRSGAISTAKMNQPGSLACKATPPGTTSSGPAPPVRAISLLPSGSEIAAFVGGMSQLVARSHECDFPSSLQPLPSVTGAVNEFVSSSQMHAAVSEAISNGAGLYTIDAATVIALKPTLIITQSLCSVCSIDMNVVQKFVGTMPEESRPNVLDLNPMNIQDVIADCERVGEALGLEEEGKQAAAGLRRRLDAMLTFVQEQGKPAKGNVAFLEWTDPLFCGGHWTPQLIHMAGGTHPMNPPWTSDGGAPPSEAKEPSTLIATDPDWIVISPCGLDLDTAAQESVVLAKQQWWQDLRAVREGRVVLVDGNAMFNRPGP
eukprot:gene2810-12687_t